MARFTDVDQQTQFFRDLSEDAIARAQGWPPFLATLKFSSEPTLKISVGDFNDIPGHDYAENLPGTNGKDYISAYAGNDTLSGFDGNDTLHGGLGDDYMIGGNGSDVYYVDSYFDIVRDSQQALGGYDIVYASASFMLEEASMIESISTTDVNSTTTIHFTGTSRDEYLRGNAGFNSLVGLGGDDALYGNGGGDTLYGNSGHDYLDGGAAGDAMYGGTEDDIYIVDDIADKVIEYNGEGTDRILTSVSYILEETSYVENLTATSGNVSYLGGNALSNTLKGASSSAQTLNGGGGQDNFVITAGFIADSIADFSILDHDKIQLENTAIGTQRPLSEKEFFFGKAAHDKDDRVIYDYSNGHVYFDQDGTGTFDTQKLIAILTSTPTNINASDFYIVN